MNRGVVRVHGMRFWGRHGAAPGEQDRAQPIDVDIELTCDFSRAVVSDDLADTIDYSTIYRICEREVTEHSYALLEALAGRIVKAVLLDNRILRVTVRLRKPRLLEGATPEVELSSSREER